MIKGSKMLIEFFCIFTKCCAGNNRKMPNNGAAFGENPRNNITGKRDKVHIIFVRKS